MRANSLKAWEKVSRELTPRQMQVFEKVFTFPGKTEREIAEKMKVPVHTISGRFTELRNLGILRTEGVKFFDGNRIPHDCYFINRRKVKV